LDTRGRHLLVEYIGCNKSLLNDIPQIQNLMEQAAVAANCKVVASVFHPFKPQGVSGVVVIEESHLSIHTWPEHNYAAVDFFTCGQGKPEAAHEVLLVGLQASNYELIHVDRGVLTGDSFMRVNRITFNPDNSSLESAQI